VIVEILETAPDLSPDPL